jgi:hypothetical protein
MAPRLVALLDEPPILCSSSVSILLVLTLAIDIILEKKKPISIKK